MRASAFIRTAVFLFLGALAGLVQPATAGTGIAGAAPSATASAAVQGDVNCSGAADSIDSLQILRSVAGLNTNAACLADAGDVNCDSAVNSVDALRVLRHVAGLTNTTPDGCTPIGDALGPPPSSFDLIDKALADGDIDSETALVYGVYATFLDGRLPDQYRGDDSGGPADSDALLEAASRFDSLSPSNQAAVAPFLIPPAYEGSWLNPQGAGARGNLVLPAVCADASPDWGCVDGTTANVRVWWQTRYPEDEAQAQGIASAMDTTIWPTLTSLMGTPPSDSGLAHDGGSGAVDIYLVDAARSVAPEHPTPGCKKTPAYIDLARGAPMDVVAHEFMHVLQWSFDVSVGCMYQPGGEYNWLAEATATWAQDYVYPQGNGEHYIADWYMEKPGLPLETADDRHEYGAYLFFLQVTRFYGTEQIVRTVWNNTTQYRSLEAVDHALPGGLTERWPAFAGCLWNRAPVDCFAQWDGLAQGAEAFVNAQRIELGTAATRSFELDGGVKHMSASFARFEFPDDKVQSVVFDNTLAGYPLAAVQALAKIDGEWQGPLDWTDRAKTSFCRDATDQHIEELVIIISNSDWELKGKLLPAEQPSLAASTGCTSVTLSWDADVADVTLQPWVLPQSASNLDEARDQQGQPGYDTNDTNLATDCLGPFQTRHSTAIGGVTADAQYIAVYWWGWCSNRIPEIPPVVPFTITIQYADGHEEVLNEEFVYAGDYDTIAFLIFGPFDFAPPQ